MKKFVILVDADADTITKVAATAKAVADYNSMKALIWGAKASDYTVDIITRKIGGKSYALVVDDEGLLHPSVRTKAIGMRADGQPFEVLAGNVLICGTKGENLVPLTEKEADEVLATVEKREGWIHDGGQEGPTVLVQDDFLVYTV